MRPFLKMSLSLYYLDTDKIEWGRTNILCVGYEYIFSWISTFAGKQMFTLLDFVILNYWVVAQFETKKVK